MADESSPSSIHDKPKNWWTTIQREVVCVLLKFYENPLSESVQIFNALFEKDLIECNFTQGISHHSLRTQWYELYTSGSAVWERVHIETLLSDESGRWEDLREEIEETAKLVGVTLIKRKFENFRDTSKFGSRPQKKQKGITASDDRESEDTVASFEKSLVAKNSIQKPGSLSLFTSRRSKTQRQRVSTFSTLPKSRTYSVTPRRPQQHQNPRGSNQPSSNISSSTTTTPASSRNHSYNSSIQAQTPSVLYRYWGTNSNGFNSLTQFVAGLFCNNPQSIYTIASYTSDGIKTVTFNHLMRMKTSSPYISASATLFSPLHRALRQEVPAAVSIIDVSKLDSTTLFSAQKIIRENDLGFAENYTYKGHNEWLIWREIPASAIICSFTVNSLLKIVNDFSDIESVLHLNYLQRFERAADAKKCLKNSSAKVDESTGMIIGKFLQLINLPEQYLERVSECIPAAWRIEGMTWNGRGLGENSKEKQESYLAGVRKGYRIPAEQSVHFEPQMEDEIDEGEEATSSPIMTPDSSPLGKSQFKEEGLDGQDETRSLSPIATPNSSPLDRVSGVPTGLRIYIPAGQNRQPTLAGMKREMREDEIGINLIECEVLDTQETMPSEAIDADSRIHDSANEDDDGNDDGNTHEDETYDNNKETTTVDEPVDRFTAERNRINRLLNYS